MYFELAMMIVAMMMFEVVMMIVAMMMIVPGFLYLEEVGRKVIDAHFDRKMACLYEDSKKAKVITLDQP